MRRLCIALFGIALLSVLVADADARSRHRGHRRHHTVATAEPEVPMDPNRWCTGGFPITNDQQIRGCTALINAGRSHDLHATAYYNRANAYFAKGDLSSAINDYGEALSIRPQYNEALYNRAVAYRATKNYEAAIIDYGRVLSTTPSDVAALVGRGTAYGMKGDNQRGIIDLTRAITIGTRDVTARLQRGHALVRIHGWADALADYDQVLSIAPSNPEAYFGRGYAKTYSGDLKGGNADLTQAYLLDHGIQETMAAQNISAPIERPAPEAINPEDRQRAPTETEAPVETNPDSTSPTEPTRSRP